ncbi:hypothetical protein CEUSTIGMA_g1933.t1 [Chlamydomonas eustigma]|uniref:adenylate kinase n=1 Tax=Chlamydomonas eustigma TaxID=1157962 RepID=A0A250WUG9_9CHLO|nr:hypothetical protein CEUSTIGMA_g1933.t1 [Chlamydomonas eustigma]|eukprot:GAX74484.1 hypothetical protein CEUSTIGMA_g1933.t1 [Chlamydomonas eustigma]
MTTSGSEAFLIDGFPRKLDQLQAFEEKIKPCDGVLVFTVPDDVAVERLVKRGESSGRADDNEETIRKRMEVFKEESQPVIDALKGSGRVAEINAEGSPDEVFIGVEAFMDPMVEVKASEDDPQVEKEDDALTADEHVKGEDAPAEQHTEAEEISAEHHAEPEEAPAEHHAEAEEAPAEHHAVEEEAPAEKNAEAEEAPAEHHAEAEEAPAEHHAEAEEATVEHHPVVEEAPAEHHTETEEAPAEHHAEAEEATVEHHTEAEKAPAEQNAEVEEAPAEHHAEAEEATVEHHTETEKAPAEHHTEAEEATVEHHTETEKAPAEQHEAEEALPASSHTVDPSARIVFVLGAPGAGKGTQCARIVQHYGWSHLSTGDLLRKEVSEGTALGVQASSIMKEGGMVPTALILDLLIAAMASSPAGSNFLVDGFPRKLDQLREFEAKIKPCDGVLAFTVPDDVAVERLVKRGESSGRADDNEETIRKRMEVFKEESQPVIDALKGSGRVAEIDAQGTPKDIFVEVRKFMDVISGVTATEEEHHGDAEKAVAEQDVVAEEVIAEHVHNVEEAAGEELPPSEQPLSASAPVSSHTVDPSARIVFVLGAPGAGKGTQCARIVQHYGWSHLSTGDLLRKEVSEGTALGVQASSIMKEGGMVPTALILDLLIAAMASSPAGSSFLVDGFPRKLDQLREFEAKIKPCDGVLAFTVPDDVAVERLVKRGESSGRADDNEETIRKRMEVFKEESQPVIDALKGSGRVAEIDAQGAPEDIFVEVRKFMDVISGVEPEAHNEEAGVQPEAHNDEVPVEEAAAGAEDDVGDDSPPSAAAAAPVEEAAAGAEDDVGDDSPPSAAAAAPVEEAAAGAEDDVGDDSPPSAAAAAPVEDLPDVAQFSQKEVDAVVKIQAGARGMLGRKRVKKIKGHSGQVEASSNETGQEEEGADEDGLEMQQEEGEEEQDAPPKALLEEPPAHVAETVAESKPEVQDLQVEEDTSTTTAPPVIQPVPPSQSKPTTPQRPVSSSPRPGSKPSVPPAAAAAAPPEVLPAPTHTPPTLLVQPPVNQRAASIARATPTKTLPVRQYMDMTVVPILREALRSLNDSRPNDPLRFLADYLLAARAKRLNGGAQT